jgi:DNA-binding NarL/FixJ family response regulator
MQTHSLTSAGEPLRVCVLGDIDLLNDLLKKFLAGSDRYCIIDAGANYKDALVRLKIHPPDLLIISYHFGTNHGDVFARELRSIHHDVRVIGYSINFDERQVLRMLDAGAKAFFNGSSRADELQNAIETVMQGRLFYNECIYQELIEFYHANRHQHDAIWKTTFDHLTVFIIHLLLTPQSRQQMADSIGIGIHAFNRILANVKSENNCQTEMDLLRLLSVEGLMRL